jgi:hypothetical protein
MAKSLKHQILGRALELVSDERSWTRSAIARTARDRACDVMHPDAKKFCAVGAIHRAIVELKGGIDDELAKSCVREVSDFFALPYINDFEGRKVVIALFKRALERV